MVDNVAGVGPVGGGAPARGTRFTSVRPAVERGRDSVELSSDVMHVKGIEGIRPDKVMEVRRAIQSGTYLTEEKLDIALDRAIEDALGT